MTRGGRVLVYANSLELGGSQINAVQLAAAVRSHGWEPLVVGPQDSRPDGGPSLFDLAHDLDVPLLAIDRPTTTRDGARRLDGLATAHRADLVHVYGTWGLRAPYWGPARLAKRPLVMTVYEMEVDGVVFRHAPLIVGARYLVDDLAARPGPVHLVSPPVDLCWDDPRVVDVDGFLGRFGLDPRHRRIVIVSRLDGLPLRPSKTAAIEAAIDLLASVGAARPDLDLVVVGTGKDAAALQARAAAVNRYLGRDACVFTGPLADPRAAYASATVVIGMGSSAARALAHGKPLVVSGEFGTFETFDPDSAERLFGTSFWSEQEVTDPAEELARELLPLLADESRLRALGEFGRPFAQAHFGLTAMAHRLADIYRDAFAYTRRDWAADLGLEWVWAQARVRRVLGDPVDARDLLSRSGVAGGSGGGS